MLNHIWLMVIVRKTANEFPRTVELSLDDLNDKTVLTVAEPPMNSGTLTAEVSTQIDSAEICTTE